MIIMYLASLVGCSILDQENDKSPFIFWELGLGWRSIDNYSHFICGYFNYFSLDLFVFYTFYIRLRKEHSSIIMKSSSYFFIIYHTVILFLNLLRLAK
jgi:hypothetical protein